MTETSTASSIELGAMSRALELAVLGPAGGENPRVGCVLIDSEGNVVAEGHHRGAGTAHAEVNALNTLQSQGASAAGLTAVVTLEPCNHQGKTGPCAQALVDAGITRVVYASSDPGERSSGGATTLEAAGVSVTGGVRADEADAINRHWVFALSSGRPFVTAKWAQSLDGRSAAEDSTSQWITGPTSRARVHKDRSEHGAIMVGTNTALIDNPSLTARTDSGLYDHQPLAVVVGHRAIAEDAAVRSHPGGFVQISSHDPEHVLTDLYERGIRSVYLEGGSTLVSAFLAAGLVDEIHITMGPMLLGGPHMSVNDIGVSSMSDAISLSIDSVEQLDNDLWVVATPTARHSKES
jgi:diaminohydroxyphosphoribosylaminopyrimidine deaminase/5-amino-6-(5-phosphoribosylamino)uracil reductase